MRRRRRSYLPFIAAGVAVAVVAFGVVALTVRARLNRMADESFAQAEQLFQDGAFHKARQEFELFCSEYSGNPRVHQARIAANLSKVAQSLDDDQTDPQHAIESLDKFAMEARSEPTLKERWPVIVAMAQRTARSSLDKANRTLASADLESGELWLKWLHAQQQVEWSGSDSASLANLDELWAKGRDAIAEEGRRRGFLDAADQAIAQGGTAIFAQAFRAYERWRAESNGTDPAIAAKFTRLQQALRAQIRFTSPPPPNETPAPVPQLSLEPFTLLSTRNQHRSVSRASDRTVFARSNDLCYGVDSATGAPRWLLRVGYDAALPQLVTHLARPAAVLAWFSGDEPMISLCDAATGETIWSWKSPDLLSGPPAVTRDAVFVATRGGTLWHLDLEQGTARGVAELPEPIDSPPTLREDGRGVCVVGARQAVYLFDVAREVPECSDVVLLGRRADTAHCQIMWVPPYIAVFENDLMNRCFVRVLFQEPNGYRQVRQIELDGRVWQAPVLDGADILVVTDRWKTHCFGLDPGNSAVNLYTAATQVKTPAELIQPTRPYTTRISEIPFVLLTDGLHGYRADRAQGLIREVWTRPLPHTESRGVQPLQAVNGLIVATLQEPESDGVLLQAFSTAQGELVWETRLASSARDLAVLNRPGAPVQVVARTDSGHVFLISRDPASAQSNARLLGIPSPVSLLRPSQTTGELVYGCDSGNAVQIVSTQDWARVAGSLRTQPIASELTVYEGELVVHSSDVPQRRRGRWVLYMTADRTLVIRPIDGTADDIHGVRLPAVGQDAWKWAPVVSGDSEIIVAHPAGEVCRVRVHEADDIVHLQVAERRTDLPLLLTAPTLAGASLVCMGRDGRCLALDSKSLRTQSEWRAPAAIQSAIAEAHHVWLCLADSTILSLRCEAGKFEQDWQQPLHGPGWSLAAAAHDRLLAVHPDGFMVAMNKTTGELGRAVRTPAPLVLPPCWAGDELVLATVDGGVFFVSAPAAP